MKNTWPHTTVLIKEALEYLKVQKGEWYVDATLGAGGHTEAMCQAGALVIGIDQDKTALTIAAKRLSTFAGPVHLVRGNFSQLTTLVTPIVIQPIAGILFDLGVSSMQFDTPTRGFSFQHEAPLDMRMDQDQKNTAATIINSASAEELYALFTTLAQEKRARPISEAIVRARQIKPITTTTELVAVIESVVGHQRSHLHPATKVFQALRMTVNQEGEALKQALEQALLLLKPGGRLVTISFHEGEDRIVKQWVHNHKNELTPLTKHPVNPSLQEIAHNPRSRSARLRAVEKK